jgi:hypothetical protein
VGRHLLISLSITSSLISFLNPCSHIISAPRVAVAVRSVIGTSLMHQALVMGVDLLVLAPVPGLRAAAVIES